MVKKKDTKKKTTKKTTKRKTAKRSTVITKKEKKEQLKQVGFAFNEEKISAVEREVSKPSAWFRSVQRNECVNPSYIWLINKEKIYENYNNRKMVYYDINGQQETHPIGYEPKCNHLKPSHEILILPNGKVITPIRQYCETKILPPGEREALFFDFGSVDYASINEGQTADTTKTTIKSTQAETNPRGTRITVGYQQSEETSPIDIIASANRAFGLESISDETVQVLQSFNNDTDIGYKRKSAGGGSKVGRWIGPNGNQITNDNDIVKTDKLTIKAVLNAVNIIANEGLDTSGAILYTTGNAIRDLLDDPEIDLYTNNTEILTEATLERITGVKFIRTSACPNTSTKTVDAPENILQKIVRKFWGRKRGTVEINGEGNRSVLFLPNVAFGLVSGINLTMEAQRRNELQAIHLTGTQKVAAVCKNIEATCRLSHA